MDHAHPTASPAEPGGTTTAPAVLCEDLVVRYGSSTAVDGLSFAAHPGEIVALLGPNGAGKTSTVEVLEGYRSPSAGHVRVLGLDPRSDRTSVVPRIGVMLQKGGVYPMLGPAQVMRLFAAYYDKPEDADGLLHQVGLTAVARTPWRRLSGGEQQRLSLALALIGRPEVLFLDEPTAGVDPEGRLVVRDLIAAQREQGRCVLLTTHELGEAERLADRVLIIDHGRLLASGTPAELAARAADGAVRFRATPGLDHEGLADAVGPGTTVHEDAPGYYRLVPAHGVASPDVVAALASWLAARGLALDDLRTGPSLEDAYLAITGQRGQDTNADADGAGSPGTRRGSRRRRRTGRGV